LLELDVCTDGLVPIRSIVPLTLSPDRCRPMTRTVEHFVVVVIVDEHPAAARAHVLGCFNDPAVNLKRAASGVADAVR
jgi:hypothetical protein